MKYTVQRQLRGNLSIECYDYSRCRPSDERGSGHNGLVERIELPEGTTFEEAKSRLYEIDESGKYSALQVVWTWKYDQRDVDTLLRAQAIADEWRKDEDNFDVKIL